jgi:mono/diheme cytochrome c family protein
VVPRKAANPGARLFETNCASCHPNGGNIIAPNLPLRGSAQLADFTQFLECVRHPRMPNGARGAMPDFSSAQLSDTQVRQIYQYVIAF